jgi:cellulose synthase/poly-beta-1,6-N-acetylglucosamine synthase-like glycosyltransferase
VTTLSIVVPATNHQPDLPRCTAAIRAQMRDGDQLIVVDGPPTAGPAAARNIGLWQATGDAVAFIDADILIAPGVLDRLRSALDRDPGLTAVFGSYDDRPTAPGVVSRFRNLLHHHVHQRGAGLAHTYWGGIGAIRREVAVAAGGFDEHLFPGPAIEDVELGVRLIAGGARIVLDPEIQGTHTKRWTLGLMLYTDVVRRGAPWVELILRTRSAPAAMNVGWRERASLGASMALTGAAARRRRRATLTALGAMLVLNRSFYALLARRLGLGGAAMGVCLHVIHNLAAAAAIPLGVARHVARGSRSSSSSASTVSPSSR